MLGSRSAQAVELHLNFSALLDVRKSWKFFDLGDPCKFLLKLELNLKGHSLPFYKSVDDTIYIAICTFLSKNNQ